MSKVDAIFDSWFNRPLSDTTPPLDVIKTLTDDELEDLDERLEEKILFDNLFEEIAEKMI